MKKPTTPESMAGQRKGKHTKLHTILKMFVSGKSLNRFQAEQLGDHCLPSTISTLANSHGLAFKRKWESVPNRFGDKTRVIRYKLADSSLERAIKLLNKRRGIKQ